tara:strand:+ start:1216 stop:4692 length:3477 start_codon:yes stop_codon:yes gene_type:complete
MSTTDRQNRLLVAENWKRIYQSFRNADFQSYDFDNLRRTMIAYLRTNYPEDFNDYIESSEYLALIDLIAFLGQNISFRIDLNARENFLELAERRESVLRLARLLSYNPKRNQAAQGLLKVTSVSTTEEVVDSNNFNLANQQIQWNDPTNTDWYEQFIKVMNSALPANGTFGRPLKKEIVDGVPNEQYRFNAVNTDIPTYGFTKTVQGKSLQFEVVSTDLNTDTKNAEEEIPLTANSFAYLYKDDSRGPASSNTGFFCTFKQGSLDSGQFVVNTPTTNQVIDIDAANINNDDVWLYKLDASGQESEYWTKVDAVEGNNIIYNSVSKKIRSVYSVLTRVSDRISLVFSDGTFGELPQGVFKVFYRTSNNQSYVIKPTDMTGIQIKVPYLSRSNTVETITLNLELKYTVANSSTSETNESIKQNAPSTYYTQNRMVTAEDYNVAPLGISQDIIKVKSVNRFASGISRYYDLLDATGKYSSTNLYANDGIIYKENLVNKDSFTYITQTDIESAITNKIEPILKDRRVLNYYLTNFTKVITSDLKAEWVQTTSDTNRGTGHLIDESDVKYKVGTFTANNLRLLEAGSLLKFEAPTGYHFLVGDKTTLIAGAVGAPNTLMYKWVKVISVNGDGTTNTTSGLGPIVLNDSIPTQALLTEIRPKLTTSINDSVKVQIIDQAFANNTFGLRYDVGTRQWRLITEVNLDTISDFSTGKTGDVSSQNLDASWLLWFKTDGEKYNITYRAMRYVYESDNEIKFYYDSSDKIYDNKTGKIIKDKIQVLSINTQPMLTLPFTSDYNFEITKEYRDADGYVDSKKVEISFFDADDDGVVDNPGSFVDIVNETVSPTTKYIFQKKYTTTDGVEDYQYVTQASQNILVLTSESAIGAYSSYDALTIFFAIDTGLFKQLSSDKLLLTQISNFKAFIGRADLKFRYVHAADNNKRIDPSSTNLIDTYLLTRLYDTSYRKWLNGDLTTKPLPPSSDQLYRSYGAELDKIKSISDEVIYHPVKYKILFGSAAENSLQATFKIVKNTETVSNDNEVKSNVINAMNEYFSLENWEFGESFYFSELSTYIMNQLAPSISSIVIVPSDDLLSFGSLYEINSESDEIFISGATVENVEIIDTITATKLKSSGTVITASTEVSNTGIQSSSTAYTSTINTGGSSY